MMSDNAHFSQLREVSTIDDDPLYDSVASDEDYASVPGEEKTASPNTLSPHSQHSEVSHNSNKDSIISLDSVSKTNQILEQLTKQLKNSDNTITDLKNEVLKLRQYVKVLQTENSMLKNKLSQTKASPRANGDSGFDSLEHISETDLGSVQNGRVADEVDFRHSRRNQRPTSMYETREGITKVSNWHVMKNQLKYGDPTRNTMHSSYVSTQDRETVLQCTEQITRTIQNLCRSIQDPEKEECVSSAEGVKLAIIRLASHLPKETEAERMKQMIDFVSKLQPECQALQSSHKNNDSTSVDVHFGNIRDIAFHLAKITKDVVTKYSSSQ
nr:unnamed protein product [Callosobruchus analis]